MTRIEKLTDEMRATFQPWTEQWLGVGWRTGRLSEAEWDVVGRAMDGAHD